MRHSALFDAKKRVALKRLENFETKMARNLKTRIYFFYFLSLFSKTVFYNLRNQLSTGFSLKIFEPFIAPRKKIIRPVTLFEAPICQSKYTTFYIPFQPTGEKSKNVGIKCCDVDTRDDVCSLNWGLHPTCEPLALECIPGCVPNSETDLNSPVSVLESYFTAGMVRTVAVQEWLFKTHPPVTCRIFCRKKFASQLLSHITIDRVQCPLCLFAYLQINLNE